jgi:hypothetical protein
VGEVLKFKGPPAELPAPYASVAPGADRSPDGAWAVLDSALRAYREVNGTERDSVNQSATRAAASIAGQQLLALAARRLGQDRPDPMPGAATIGDLTMDDAFNVLALAGIAFEAGRNVGYPEGEAAGVELGERRASSRVTLGGSKAERALTWIEHHANDGIALVARALSEVGETRPTHAASEALARVAKAEAKRSRKAARRGR